MNFRKIDHPANFRFCDSYEEGNLVSTSNNQSFETSLESLGNDVFRLSIQNPRWRQHGSHALLEESIEGPSQYRAGFAADGSFTLVDARNRQSPLLEGSPLGCFGVSGQRWLFQFTYDPTMSFFGLGENNQGLEKTGLRTKFWNTDLFGDFSTHEIQHGRPNPMYVTIPWLIVRNGGRYCGVLINNPDAVFMNLASDFSLNQQAETVTDTKTVYCGAPDGNPELYFIAGPSLPELTRKLQALVGRTPRPPLWALGHQQCRWGYTGPTDLQSLDQNFQKHEIPCDGLWLDIDYMDGYRVFTFDPEHWGDTEASENSIRNLNENGRHIVPILDPGVKVDSSYPVCQDGLEQDVFCKNDEGLPFVGYVWPGQTYFPDFSKRKTRDWWSEYVKKMANLGISGAWLDMNDPSIGAVELDGMRFEDRSKDHSHYHNQYALGMAQATRDGFLKSQPNRRPFLLSRSAFISSGRYTAVWCGDNVSNWHHLRMSIPVSIGLALSGIPFNGSDVCGFDQDTNPELAMAWYKAAFLQPFFRNHSARDTRPQEPWALGEEPLQVAKRYIRLRYKLLPYLYQLFIQQEKTGEAILRPLFYDFDDTDEIIEDQFLIGPAIMQAPILQEHANDRSVAFPGERRWFCASSGKWIQSPNSLKIQSNQAGTPLYFKEGSLVPMQVGELPSQRNDLSKLEIHCFLDDRTSGLFRLRYTCDDGASFNYQRGEESSFELEISIDEGQITACLSSLEENYAPLTIKLFFYHDFKSLKLIQEESESTLLLNPSPITFTDQTIMAYSTESFSLRT